jgi:hypothetical protein
VAGHPLTKRAVHYAKGEGEQYGKQKDWLLCMQCMVMLRSIELTG